MKYLLVLCFVGLCFSDEKIGIEKYELSLVPKEEEFEGKVSITFSKPKDGGKIPTKIPIDTGEYEVVECTYKAEPPKEGTALDAKDDGCWVMNDLIYFPSELADRKVYMKFVGTYDNEKGFFDYRTAKGDRLYVADMARVKPSSIFPCQLDGKSDLIITDYDKNTMISNVDSLRGQGDNVELKKVFFVRGDIKSGLSNEKLKNLHVYVMKNSGKMPEDLEKIFESINDMLATRKTEVQVLLTPLHNQIKYTGTSNIMISSDNAMTPGSDRRNLVFALMRKAFETKSQTTDSFMSFLLPAFLTLKALNPSFETKFTVEELQSRAFEEDGFKEAKSVRAAMSGFGSDTFPQGPILYSKGLSIVRSLESVCGEEKFNKGIKVYLSGNAATAATAFENCFKDGSQADNFFKTWVDTPGYPVVHIESKNNEYNLTQERFLWHGGNDTQKWEIPIRYVPKEESEAENWLPTEGNGITVKTNATYFILNNKYKGFYRVNYDGAFWDALVTQMNENHTVIDEMSRAQLIDDVFSLSRSTYSFRRKVSDYVKALRLLEYLPKERSYPPLKAALNAFKFLDSALSGSVHAKFAALVKQNLKELYKNLKIGSKDGEKNEDLLNDMIFWACKFGVEECVQNCTDEFNKFKFDRPLSEIETTVACNAVRNNVSNWMSVYARIGLIYLDHKTLMTVLGCTRDTVLLKLLAASTLNGPEQMLTMFVSSAVEANPDNVNTLLNVINSLSDIMEKSFGKDYLRLVVDVVSRKLNTESAKTLKSMAEKVEDENLKKKIDEACEIAKVWADNKEKRVSEYFVQKTGDGSQTKPVAVILLATTLIPLANHILNS